MSPDHPVRRVGMLFSGGPAPAANAVISAAAISFLNAGIQVFGFLDGYEDLERFTCDQPLVEGRDYLCLTRDLVSGIRSRKDIILRTSRANPGKPVRELCDLVDPEKNVKLRAVYEALEYYEIDALVSIGGDDTLKTANYLYRMQELLPELRRIRIVHLPKTIDNDYFGIDWTFGFTSAAHYAAMTIRNIGADARSTKAWYVLEMMGRKAGWLTYAAGIAGEATRMMSVEDFEDGFDAEAVAREMVDLMETRAADGREYGVICIAEGLAELLSEEQQPCVVDEHGNSMLGAVRIGEHLAGAIEREYERRTGRNIKVRAKQIGYETRCAEPGAFDVMLGSQLGFGAFRAIVEDGRTGVMVSVRDQLDLKYVPFDELIDPDTFKTRIRFIRKDSDFYRLARALEYQQREHSDTPCE
ncbi:MAG: 6-phosphofructokinase [Actinobacteria bacterium HGW-Actinobacteria-7]|nr:MAG: 6-phosphofructokinase [Actinobacteria bacterium HGW-Actinobacteria-7]